MACTVQKDHVSDVYVVAPQVHLKLVELPGTWHLSNCKAHFIKQILLEQFTDVDLVFYFDTDIVIKHSWDTFVEWARDGVVLVLDVADSYMSPHHVFRRAWQSLAAKQGLKCRDFTGYVNGGCIGINRAYTEFALVWSALMEELERDGADMQRNEKLDWEAGVLANGPGRAECHDHGNEYADRLARPRSNGHVSMGKHSHAARHVPKKSLGAGTIFSTHFAASRPIALTSPIGSLSTVLSAHSTNSS